MIKEGVTDTVVTSQEGWEETLKKIVEEKKYGCFFDALGGGPTLDKILQNITPTTGIYIYGVLENKPFTLSNPTLFFAGMKIDNFLVFSWYGSVDQETRDRVKQTHAKYLQN